MPGNAVDQIIRMREFPSSSSIPADKLQSPKLFVYCSTPRPVLDHEVAGGLYPRPLYRNNVKKPEGWHSYYNISWDPRVRRGEPLQTQNQRAEEECNKIRRKLTQPSKYAKKVDSTQKKKPTQARTSDPQVMVRAANMRFARLAISALRPKEKDAFVVENNEEVDQEELCYKGQRIGAAKVLPKGPSIKRNLKDQACQIMPTDFFNFDHEVIPILERLIGAVCYQARLEVLEEAELEALKAEKLNFEKKKRGEEEQEEKMKHRMEKQVEEQKRQVELQRKHAHDLKLEKDAFSIFAGTYVKYNVEEGMKAMGGDWEKGERIRTSIQSDFMLWLNFEVNKQVQLHKDSRKLLDDIIHNVVAERQAVHAMNVWKEVYDDPVRSSKVFSENLESSRVPPPTPGSSVYFTSDEDDFEEERGSYSTAGTYLANDDY